MIYCSHFICSPHFFYIQWSLCLLLTTGNILHYYTSYILVNSVIKETLVGLGTDFKKEDNRQNM